MSPSYPPLNTSHLFYSSCNKMPLCPNSSRRQPAAMLPDNCSPTQHRRRPQTLVQANSDPNNMSDEQCLELVQKLQESIKRAFCYIKNHWLYTRTCIFMYVSVNHICSTDFLSIWYAFSTLCHIEDSFSLCTDFFVFNKYLYEGVSTRYYL